MSDSDHSAAWAKGRLDAALRNLDGLGDDSVVREHADPGDHAAAAGAALAELDSIERKATVARQGIREAQQVLDALDDADHPTAGDDWCWNCRDCGFVGAWLTVDGRCPECGGRDLPTEER